MKKPQWCDESHNGATIAKPNLPTLSNELALTVRGSESPVNTPPGFRRKRVLRTLHEISNPLLSKAPGV
jgi:hypothetical protein